MASLRIERLVMEFWDKFLLYYHISADHTAEGVGHLVPAKDRDLGRKHGTQFIKDIIALLNLYAFWFFCEGFLDSPYPPSRCESSGDLYPVTKPSTSPVAFVST
ncbi:hypothetical protein Tco_0916676 [Tanacetum coccineum]